MIDPKRYKLELKRIFTQLDFFQSKEIKHFNSVFIISTGRTGTKFLAHFLNRFENVYSVHEPNPDFLNLGIKYATGDISLKKAAHLIEKNRKYIFRDAIRKKTNIYIESNNRLFSLIKPLINIYSKIKIIHIIRDGRDFVRSGLSRPYGGYYSINDPYPRLTAKMFKDDEFFDKWDSLNQFEKICWLWQKKDSFILKDIKNIRKSYTIKFEEIFNPENEYQGLKDISKILGLDENIIINNYKNFQKTKENKTKTFSISHWSKWDKKKLDTFEKIAGDHMKKYYEYYSK